MATCIYCFKKIGMFDSKKCKNGAICNVCAKKIPNCFPYQYYDSDEMLNIQKYAENPSFSNFSQTATLGSLLIDEPNGLFAIESKQNVFSLFDLKEYDIHPTNIRSTTEKVLCDIEFKCQINSIDISIKKIIKKNVPCKCKRIDEKHMEWLYPNEISLINQIITESIRKKSEDFKRFIEDYGRVTNNAKLIAESMLLVGDNYTKDEIKIQRNRLLNIYHPDNGGDAAYCERITTSYNYLVSHYKEPEVKNDGRETGIKEAIKF